MDANFAAHPTSFLPPLVRLSTWSTQDVVSAVDRLRNLYWPPKPPPLPTKITLPQCTIARRIHDDSVPDSGYASAEDDEGDTITHGITHVAADSDPRDTGRLQALRADTLQREFAIKWITGFIARSGLWIDAACSPEDHAARTSLLDDVTALLSAFIGEDDDPEEAAIMRTFTFATPDGGVPVTVQLNDEPLLEEDHTSVGLQSWGSCIRLGERICADPGAFSLSPNPSDRPLRVLELGAGTGLLSILAAKLLAPSPSSPTPAPAVVATDYHPDVLSNLSTNVETNFRLSSPYPAPSSSTSSYTPVHVHALDWETPVYAAPLLDKPFDVVLAADVVYHPEHARWIRGCVERLLRRPSPETVNGNAQDVGGVFWMIIAVRPIGRHEGLDGNVVEVFGDEAKVWPEDEGMGLRLTILEMEETGKVEGVGRADESGYKLFKIGWKKVSSAGA